MYGPLAETDGIIRFGAFELALHTRELRKRGLKVRLEEQLFHLLANLVERSPEIVSREDLRGILWPAGVVVDFDHGLNRAVNKLRAILGDSGATPRFIETLWRRGYRFIAPVSRADTRHASGDKRIRLAVLPFRDVSDRPKEFLTEGITEEMISRLGHLSPERLAVIARRSTMPYRDTAKGIRQIGGELNADLLLEGSLRSFGRRVCITAQLIDARDETQIWSAKEDCARSNLGRVQDRLAAQIAESLRIELLPPHRSTAGNSEAHVHYLQGLFHHSLLSGYRFRAADQLFCGQWHACGFDFFRFQL